MRITPEIKRIAIIGAGLALAACGGGGGGGSSTPDGGSGDPPPSGGIDRGGVAAGPIDGFGSVIVNGIHFDTAGASFTVDGQSATQADLSVGQVVLVVGTISDDGVSGEAESVEYEEAVKGPIEAGSLSVAEGRFRVLGQTVRVTATTVIDDSIPGGDLSGLAEGDRVEVSGLFNTSGEIVATRVEPAGGAELEITGVIGNLDTSTSTFAIGALTVDYSAAQLDDFPQGQPADGDLVEAEGTAFGAGGELVATRVELKDELDVRKRGEDGDDFKIEGLVTALRSASDFDVGGVRVITDASTEFERGGPGDLALDVRVEVEGDLRADGAILADEIEFQLEAELEIEAEVEAVNAAAGTFTVLGVAVATEAGTSFEDKRDGLQVFGLSQLQPGDWVEVRGFSDAGAFVASRVERDEAEDEVEIQGFAEDVLAPGFTVLGVDILTNALTDFEDVNDNPISAAAFFASAAGALVQVDGTWDGNVLTADEAELED